MEEPVANICSMPEAATSSTHIIFLNVLAHIDNIMSVLLSLSVSAIMCMCTLRSYIIVVRSSCYML